MTFKARAILTSGCHYLDIPYAQCVWNSVLIPPPPQAHEAHLPSFPMYPADPVRSRGVIMALYLSSHTLSQQILPLRIKRLKSLYLISVSLVEGVVDAVIDSPTFIHCTSSFLVVTAVSGMAGLPAPTCPPPPILPPVVTSSPSHPN